MIPLKDDLRLAALVERRRKLEEERRERIFNPRRRLYGIDRQTLDRQIEERRFRESEEKERNEAFLNYMVQNDKIALLAEKTSEEERRKIEKEINEFRATYQGPATRREYELYDPYEHKRRLPARVTDDDPRCGASGGQLFNGEDLCCRERTALQKQQTKAWLEQQMCEKLNSKYEQKLVDTAFNDAMIAMDKRAVEIEGLEEKCRRRLNESLLQYNMLMATEKQHAIESLERKEQEDNSAEICNSMMGDLLCENTEVCQSNLGPNRVLASMYKGMSIHERLAVRQTQLDQIRENARRRASEAQLNDEWEKLAMGIERRIMLKEQEEEKRRREIRKDIEETNRALGEEHKAYRQFLDNCVYKSQPTDDFYSQFNTTTR